MKNTAWRVMAVCLCSITAQATVQLSPTNQIIDAVNAARPLNGGAVPADYADRIGITHYGGRYHLSDKPFLVEGMENIHAMGFRSAKLWLSAHSDQMRRGYYFNSEWPGMIPSRRIIYLKTAGIER